MNRISVLVFFVLVGATLAGFSLERQAEVLRYEERSKRPCTNSTHRGTMITGVGRAGTSFLVAVLTDLGLPTGYTPTSRPVQLSNRQHAGLEHPLPVCQCSHRKMPTEVHRCLDWAQGVEIIKSIQAAESIDSANSDFPLWLGDFPGGVTNNLAHVIVPVRTQHDAAASRAALGRGKGGFTQGATSLEEQEVINDRLVSNLLVALAGDGISITILHYPKHVTDERYSWNKLFWLLGSYNVTKSKFEEAHRARRNLALVHSYSKNSSGASRNIVTATHLDTQAPMNAETHVQPWMEKPTRTMAVFATPPGPVIPAATRRARHAGFVRVAAA